MACRCLGADSIEPSGRTNVVIAAYTTAQARLKLYSYLEPLQERVLYADTDSVIFRTSQSDGYKLTTGKFLGDLTNEVPRGHIKEFVSGGPKSYAYQVVHDDGSVDTECKVRGITLNFKNAQTINFESLKRMVTERPSESLAVTDNVILRYRQSIVTAEQTKTYRIVFDKRVINNNFQTLPYGYWICIVLYM